jgi:hypothetical protein
MEVIPIPLTNLLAPVPDIRTRTYFVVHERLDVEVLRKALDDLVRHHWRKLGARVIAVAGKAGQFEYHLPQTFEDGYVLFKWTSEAKDDPIETAIPSLKCQPPTDTIGFYPAIQETEVSIGPAHWPVSRSEDDPDEPALLVHVSVYADATVVCMNILHAVADQLGLANIVKAWLGLVQGKTPPPLVGHNEDVVPHDKEFVDYKGGEMHRKGKLRVKGVLDKYLIALGFIPEFIFHPKETVLTTFLPAPLVHAIREKASKALSQEHGADPGISSGDVIAAILLKVRRLARACKWDAPRLMPPAALANVRPQLSQPLSLAIRQL